MIPFPASKFARYWAQDGHQTGHNFESNRYHYREKVKAAATAGKLNGLPMISTVMEKKILYAASLQAKDLPNRTLLIPALEVAESLKAYLLESPEIKKCEV